MTRATSVAPAHDRTVVVAGAANRAILATTRISVRRAVTRKRVRGATTADTDSVTIAVPAVAKVEQDLEHRVGAGCIRARAAARAKSASGR